MITLSVENIIVEALVGFHEDEKNKPNTFSIDVWVEIPVPRALQSDTIENTLDYAQIYDLVLDQMNVPANLVEKKAYDILTALFQRFSVVARVRLSLKKHHPCSMGNCERAGIEIALTREDYLSAF